MGRDSKRRAGPNPAATPRSAARRRQSPVSGDARAGAHGFPLRQGGSVAPRCPPFVPEHSQVSLRWVWAIIINSKGSELDISWLLSLCLIVSAGEGRGYAGDSEVDKKGAGGPTELPFIAFAIALRLARPAWFPQGQPPCRGCPAGLESLVPSGLLQRQVQGRRGCPESFEGSEDFCSPARGLQWVLNWEEKGYQLTMKEGVRSPL